MKHTIILILFIAVHFCVQCQTKFLYDQKGNIVTIKYSGTNQCARSTNVPSPMRMIADSVAPIVSATEGFRISCYPNPTSDKVIATYTLDKSHRINLNVVTLQGQLLKNVIADQPADKGMFIKDVDLHELPAGIYILLFKVDGQVFARKILKIS